MAYSQCKKSDFSQQLLKVLSSHKRERSKLVSSEPSRLCIECTCFLLFQRAMRHATYPNAAQFMYCPLYSYAHVACASVTTWGVLLTVFHKISFSPCLAPYQYHVCSDMPLPLPWCANGRERIGTGEPPFPTNSLEASIPAWFIYIKKYRMGVSRYWLNLRF